MELYDYQKRVAKHLRAGRNVILQAPTGAGKTFAALWPYLERWACGEASQFPRQCIYAVPMRVLADQFTASASQLIHEELTLAREPRVSIQTGARPEDRKFEKDLVFM